MTLPASVVVSLGYYLGAVPDPPNAASLQVRLGPTILQLMPDELLAWAGGTRASILMALGLQVEVDLATGAVEFARAHRFAPQLFGLGPSVVDPECYGIGLPGREMVTVHATAFNLWALAAPHPTIWSACVAYAEERRAQGKPIPDDEATPEQLAAGLISLLPAFFAGNAAYIDLTPPPAGAS